MNDNFLTETPTQRIIAIRLFLSKTKLVSRGKRATIVVFKIISPDCTGKLKPKNQTIQTEQLNRFSLKKLHMKVTLANTSQITTSNTTETMTIGMTIKSPKYQMGSQK